MDHGIGPINYCHLSSLLSATKTESLTKLGSLTSHSRSLDVLRYGGRGVPPIIMRMCMRKLPVHLESRALDVTLLVIKRTWE